MKRDPQGKVLRHGIVDESFNAFFPNPLPPEPPLAETSELRRACSLADQMLGRLDGLSTLIRHPDLLINFYIRKEAVLSSQIEGTQSTLSELLLFEMEPDTGTEDTAEVANYVHAMHHGLMRLKSGFPLSLRLIREMHMVLLRSGRGSRSTPGEFRTSQNWIGGSRPGNALYVPPPVKEMNEALDSLEKFLHGGAENFPVLVQCALIHVQFESIHPFLDGNGRMGRLLITLLLVERGVLVEPLLYMSLYLKQNRDEYYALLQRVRHEGDWEAWILFFLRGVTSTADKAVKLAKDLLALFEQDSQKLDDVGGRRASALQVLTQLQEMPYTTPRRLASSTGLSINTVVSSLEILKSKGIVRESSGRRGRLFLYYDYIRLMDEGTLAD
ncbi:MAG: Fic family protein [Candidatus Pacebacteria bacterium]|nr:Fic family protein [Candidatus Paceibacterota bacterium]